MTSRPTAILLSVLAFILVTNACAPKPSQVDPQAAIASAVSATLAALPTSTPQPVPTPYPSPTPISLRGLFCEYAFCIGHPAEMAFYDVRAAQDQKAPSTYEEGMLAAYSQNLFLLLIWQTAPPESDPQILLDLILDDDVDDRSGNLDVRLIGPLNVFYVPITTSATPLLPHGGASAWACGDRLFAWKTYTPFPDQAVHLMEDALTRFTCAPPSQVP
ncbi:MAG: hypothetical protein D6770_09670 [Anaerolineae bacterium]|nr:MAG: hypothetical protein D6770_09670 [Anaerolineae bacterium]